MLEKVSKHSTCPKCGFGTGAMDRVGCITMQYVHEIKLPDPNYPGCHKTVSGTGYIERCCPRCGYVWRETCLDDETEDTREVPQGFPRHPIVVCDTSEG